MKISSRFRDWIKAESSNFSYLFCEIEYFAVENIFCLCDKFQIKTHLSFLISFKWTKKAEEAITGKQILKHLMLHIYHWNYTCNLKTKEKFNSIFLLLFRSTWSIQTNAITVSAFDLIRVRVGCKYEVNCTNNAHVNHVTKQSNLVDSLRIWTCCHMQNNHQEQYTTGPAGGLPHKPSLPWQP